MDLQPALRHIVSYEEEDRDWDVKAMGMFRLQGFLRALKQGSGSRLYLDMAGAVVLAGRAGKVLVRASEPGHRSLRVAILRVRLYLALGDVVNGRTTGILKGPAVFGDRDLLRSNGRRSTELGAAAHHIATHRRAPHWQISSTSARSLCAAARLAWPATWRGAIPMSVAWFELESGARAEKAAAYAS